jgi:hypothetical protein
MYVELIRPGYPDCVAKRYIGRDRWDNVNIEFEFKSSHFNHDATRCDMIASWAHDWNNRPAHIEIVELQEVIKGLENARIEAPDKPSPKDKYTLEEHLSKATSATQELYKKLAESPTESDDDIYSKVAKYWIIFYSPKRVPASGRLLKQQLRTHLFTNGQKMTCVEPFTGEYGYK